MAIYNFEYFHNMFLLNRFPIMINMDGRRFASAENAYWALHYPDDADYISTLNPHEARSYGQKRVVREFREMGKIPPSENKRLEMMEHVLRIKFSNTSLRNQLLNTGHQKIVWINDMGDLFWGKIRMDPVRSKKTGNLYVPLKGQNHLGKILMKLRKEFREADMKTVE